MTANIIVGDCREILPLLIHEQPPASRIRCCVTSPPYFGLRNYGVDGQIGLEATVEAYVAEMVRVFRLVRDTLTDDGTLRLNLGDSYAHSLRQSANRAGDKQNTNAGSIRRGFAPIVAGLKEKDLIGVPWRVALALQEDGWYLRSDIVWAKPNPMPESVIDRPTKSHEYLFLLAKSARYYYDSAAIAEPAIYAGAPTSGSLTVNGPDEKLISQNAHRGKPYLTVSETRNRRSVWTVATATFSGAHFATFPPALIEPCILAGSERGDTILDPFAGAGTTALVADRLGRHSIGIELNPAYATMARERVIADATLFNAAD